MKYNYGTMQNKHVDTLDKRIRFLCTRYPSDSAYLSKFDLSLEQILEDFFWLRHKRVVISDFSHVGKDAVVVIRSNDWCMWTLTVDNDQGSDEGVFLYIPSVNEYAQLIKADDKYGNIFMEIFGKGVVQMEFEESPPTNQSRCSFKEILASIFCCCRRCK
ncbi:uncharacterized protein LOC141902888 [Tubulanus polymorphus]|uniref:uncharacterized protein LOC141902888 n=1 Tax=Tubulanus polymorphus TaxID=672921 RepID=UPI003DA1DD1E